MAGREVNLPDLDGEEVPVELRCETYFDLDSHPFEHGQLIRTAKSVIDVLDKLPGYMHRWLTERIKDDAAQNVYGPDEFNAFLEKNGQPRTRSVGDYRVILEPGAAFYPAAVHGSDDGKVNTVYVAAGAKVIGTTVQPRTGDIYIGGGTNVYEAHVAGPAIIGNRNEVRPRAFIRGDVIVGDGCILGGEMKGAVFMNDCEYPHLAYIGDSVCGYRTHFGNQVTSANFGLFNIIEPQNVGIPIGDTTYRTGRTKVGVIMGDYVQVGCSSVLSPGVLIRPWTIVYPLTLLRSGAYGPEMVIKSKPAPVEKTGLIRQRP